MNGSHLVGPGENIVRVDREEGVRLEREDLVDWTTFCIEGILLPVLAIFGILGNILPIITFSILYNTTKFFEIETIYLEHIDYQLDSNGTNTSTVVVYPWLNATEL